ncbi:hypothetical protein [Jannaschia sp. M317]|uniref:hypothetical protein n=1 Tax=Jannaschia sp. M317 TaxID=2867011 RepID=UPI0021A3DEEA|nr:hypothetical protein [Jannaschia sp. M317]UWQ19240.1 hypothetical protein K3551_08220 [Jannaschia sp. M317]
MEKSEFAKQLTTKEQSKPELATMRIETTIFVANSFRQFGEILRSSGQIMGTDRREGRSPFQFGSDEVYGVSLLLRVAAELSENTIRLFEAKQTYAAAALLRQIVEIEYLAWAFDQRDCDAEKWVRSDKNDRWKLFRPAKLREAADGKFRAKDYGYHCEMGGHPTPSAMTLLQNDPLVIQLLTSDLLGHISGIWEHFVRWGNQHQELDAIFAHYQSLGETTGKFLRDWKAVDHLAGLGPPP